MEDAYQKKKSTLLFAINHLDLPHLYLTDSGGGQSCVVGWQNRNIYTVEMGRGYR